jgi:hypothetical protein
VTDCEWCAASLEGLRRDARFCGVRCRQASHRFGKGAVSRRRATEPLRLAYADPPYPGLAERYYRDHPDFDDEVDHRALLSSLQDFDGWALSTSARALPRVLWLTVELDIDVRVGSWHRGARPTRSAWPLNGWEPVVYAGGRRLVQEPSDAPRDALDYVSRPRLTDPNRVVGSKPSAFAFWVFELMGARPGDDLVDLFPGSGGIARAWRVVEARAATGDP